MTSFVEGQLSNKLSPYCGEHRRVFNMKLIGKTILLFDAANNHWKWQVFDCVQLLRLVELIVSTKVTF